MVWFASYVGIFLLSRNFDLISITIHLFSYCLIIR